MINYFNLTSHPIKLNDGTIFIESGIVAGIKEVKGEIVDGIRQDKLDGIENLPSQKEGVIYIVSMPTLLGIREMGDMRKDVVTPITRGKDVVRHPTKGFVLSVPGLRTF